MARESTAAWLDDKTRTLDGKSIGRKLFLVRKGERARRAHEAIESMRSFLGEAAELGDDALEEAILDCVFLGVHAYAAQAGTWLDADAWPTAIMMQASPPGLERRDVEKALLRGVSAEAVSPEEVRVVVDTFVEATWGDSSNKRSAKDRGFAGVMISAPPQFAAIQYTIGVLWGYALRGLVLRLTLDRALGTLPESAAAARRRLERQLADDQSEIASVAEDQREPAAESEGQASSEQEGSAQRASPTLLRYAAEFFGHRDWAALCKPADAAVAFLEGELEEALPGIALLMGAEDSDPDVVTRTIVGGLDEEDSEEDDDEEGLSMEEMVMLTQDEWEAFQRRSIALGSLLADAEALVDSEAAGPLPRGARPASKWVEHLIRSGALSGVRREHGSQLAGKLLAPAQRLAEVLRTDFLASKLRSARQGLDQLYASETANSSGAKPAGG